MGGDIYLVLPYLTITKELWIFAACSQVPKTEIISGDTTLQEFIDKLKNEPVYQMRNPGVTTTINGKNKTLYIGTVASIEKATRPNLKKSLKELGLESPCELNVADETTPCSLTFKLIFK